jgi:hypothetical protein
MNCSAQSSLFPTLRRRFNAQKSQPRNGRGEIFVRTLGETARDSVSSLNWTMRDAKKTAQNRAKFNLTKRQLLLQYQ